MDERIIVIGECDGRTIGELLGDLARAGASGAEIKAMVERVIDGA